MKKAVLSVVVALIAVPGTAWAEQYICIAEHAGGIRYFEDREEWGGTRFKVDEKYIVSKSDDPNFAYEVKETGETYATFRCEKPFDEYGFMRCEGFGGFFKMNNQSMRYMEVYAVGYVTSGEAVNEVGNTPSISVGECTSF